MPSPVATYHGLPQPQPPAGPSMPRQSSRASRSSRRTRGSVGPTVVLGGGAGMLGSVSETAAKPAQKGGMTIETHLYSNSPFYSDRASPATSPLFPVHFSSASSTSSSPSPISPNFPNMYRAPSPLPPAAPQAQPQAPQAAMRTSRHVTSAGGSTSSRKSSQPGSTMSLSSTASTSSRTLRTPQSKLDHAHPQPMIVGSSSMTSHGSNGSLERQSHQSSPTPAMPSKDRVRSDTGSVRSEMRSPTPTQRSVSSGSRLAPQAPPALTRAPLPPTPASGAAASPPRQKKTSHPFSAAAAPSSLGSATGRSRGPPPPLNIQKTKMEHRLSQDWVQVHLPKDESTQRRPVSPLFSDVPAGTRLPPASSQARLPGAVMIPMKGGSPQRPGYERSNTAPPLSPSQLREERAQRQGRGSLDQLRSTSASGSLGIGNGPFATRPRTNSLSTPPAVTLEVGQGSSSGGRFGLFKSGMGKSPELGFARKSEDTLRPSLDTLRGASEPSVFRKDTKAIMKDQQRALGVASAHGPSAKTSPSLEANERKSSGLSLKKSSGALKALFQRGASGKGKDRAETPPLPSAAHDREHARFKRPSTAPREGSPISFGSRSLTPNSVSPFNENVARESTELGGRRSLGVDRSLYPAPPNLNRTHSAESQPVKTVPKRQRLPSRDLPPIPSPSTVSSSNSGSALPARSPSSAQIKSASQDSLKKVEGDDYAAPEVSTLTEASPSSSLPYLSPLRASFLESKDVSPIPTAELSATSSVPSTATDAVSTESSLSTDSRSVSEGATARSTLLPALSLDFLPLPKLDLDFGLAFDNFGVSPSTPKRGSPQKGRSRISPASTTPTRSLTTRHSPRPSPRIQRSNSERRRSQSVDGHRSPVEIWAASDFESADISRFFASPISSSAPVVTAPLVPTSEDEADRFIPRDYQADVQAQSDTSRRSAGSSRCHARTPSNASSTNDTASPSPPRTPDDQTTQGFSDLPPMPVPPAKTMYSTPPSIPLPALPEETPAEPASEAPVLSLAPAAVIEESKPVEVAKAVAKAPRPYVPVLVARSVAVTPDSSRTIISLAKEMERSLYAFRAPSSLSSSPDRSNIVRSELLPLLAEIDKRTFETEEYGCKALREQCFSWIDALLFELRVEQPANERGACLEGLGCIFESACLSERSLVCDAGHRAKFTDAMVKCMTFVMGKLGAKGVFHNTLLFSGRFLAFAFFRVPHIGEQLVTVLQPPRGALMRFTRAALVDSTIPASAQPEYPKHLEPLCFDDSRKYTARLAGLSAEFASEKERDAFLFTPGNWLRRWQSDDSELFPAFYRSYHRQLAIYLAPAIEHFEALNKPLPASVLLRAPGYAHLATIFAKKCHSYILGSVNAVTTSSSSQPFEATETAGFKGSQKPAVLETANRRLVEILSTFVNLRVLVPSPKGVFECDGQQLYSGILDLWTKNLISKTSLYAPKGVFCLFDLLDGIVDPPLDHLTGERRLTETSLLDVPHLIHVIRMILTEGEHALTLVKVIAFVFTHWEVLTANHEDRKELCLELLLEKKLFERLLLFWSQSVRSYVLRLVVFRLGHLHTQKGDGIAHEVEIESVRMLQTRLDRIKKRHDELEPKAPSEADEDKEEPYLTPYEGGAMPRSRSTITMVADAPRTGASNKAEKLLGLGFGNVEKGGDVDESVAGSKMGKATNWLKKSFGAKKKNKSAPSSTTSSPHTGSNRGSAPVSPLLSLAGTNPASGIRKSPNLSAPMPDSPDSPEEKHSPKPGEGRKNRPPRITTSDASPVTEEAAKSPSGFAFEFELPTMSPRSDTFDPTPTPTPSSPRRNSQPPSPRQPQSPHMSKSFSKRSSLLPPPTASILASETPSPRRKLPIPEEEEGYEPRFHAYAIRMLAELEDAQKEYDEWWSEGGIGRVDGAPPRLTVAWPFHEGEE